MRIMLNGEGREVADGLSVAELIAGLGLAGARVAVERNREIVPSPSRPNTRLVEGDTLEIVTFVGGG